MAAEASDEEKRYGSAPGFSHCVVDGPHRPAAEAPMTASRPNNEAIFHAARDIPDPDRRRQYVRVACGGDEALIAHVEALLAAADAPDTLLGRPAWSDPLATIDQPAAESTSAIFRRMYTAVVTRLAAARRQENSSVESAALAAH